MERNQRIKGHAKKQARRNEKTRNDMDSNWDQEGMEKRIKEKNEQEITSTMSSGSA